MEYLELVGMSGLSMPAPSNIRWPKAAGTIARALSMEPEALLFDDHQRPGPGDGR